MKKKVNVFQMMGILLILCSLTALLLLQSKEKRFAEEAKLIVLEIEKLLPQRSTGIAMESLDSQMPIGQIAGEDFIGLIEVPMFGIKLPIYSEWNPERIMKYPCRFWGSAYHNNLIIGGTDGDGQLDFLSKLDIGDLIVVTDMTGAEFSYFVARVDRSKTAEAEKLYSEEDCFTLFARDTYNMEYLIVRCNRE